MAKRMIFFLNFLVFLSNKVISQAGDQFIFSGFKGAGNKISLNGVAEIEHNGILKLTNDTDGLIGRAFFDKEIEFKNSTNGKAFSFSTAFAFSIVSQYNNFGGHGFAFTISKSKEINGALSRQYLGLFNTSDNGNFSNHIFAVEFDTVQDLEFFDINDNHVGIDINSLSSNASVSASCFAQDDETKQDLNLRSGEMIQAWIDYDSIRQELNVTLSLFSSKPSFPILSIPVDLSPIFMDYMYVGFSASTGQLSSSHYILGWSFMMKGKAESLNLSLLPTTPRPKPNHLPLILGISLSVVAFLVFGIGISLYIIKNRDVIEPWELDIGPQRFSYKELKQATRDFRDEELLGFGGSGRVYKGTLPNSNTQVAVKRISHESKQGFKEFLSEIGSIGKLRQRNVVKLLGWGRRGGDLFLVYDFMPNGSLDRYIFNETKITLSWEKRFKIIKDVAAGLLYLHEEWEQTVIHRDIKAGNVLLDSEMNGRLGDFGLAKLYKHGANPCTTKVVGTLGYIAPELTKTGKPTTGSDVFAFGALLLEVVCGRRPIEVKAMPEELILVDWVWDKWKEGSIIEVVDPRLKGEYDEREVVVVLKLGLLCSNNAPCKRPSMRQAMRYLKWEVALPELLPAPNKDDEKKVDINDFGISPGFIDFGDSYTSSSYYDTVSEKSLVYDGEEYVNVEAGSTFPTSASCRMDRNWT